jgi:hypothetical protein
VRAKVSVESPGAVVFTLHSNCCVDNASEQEDR